MDGSSSHVDRASNTLISSARETHGNGIFLDGIELRVREKLPPGLRELRWTHTNDHL
jgi:hypothetical protein